jgi:endo-1,4-beta-mannosidase
VFIQGLDFVLSEARKHGIKMILSLVNSYDSFGGRKQYVQWAREQGQSIGSDDEFFTNPVVKGFYKNHIKVKNKKAGYHSNLHSFCLLRVFPYLLK